jgi:rod shape-determining protein MreC
MYAARASRRTGLIYAVLVAVSLLLLAFSNTVAMQEVRKGFGFALAPFQGALSGVTRGMSSVFTAIAEIDQLRRINRELQARVQELEVEHRRTEEIRVQYDQLSRLLEVKSSLRYQTVAAEVVGRQTTQYERVITINQGSDRGIDVDDVVVAGGAAVVGRVVEAGPNFSRILLISDTRSTVIGLVEASRATGEIKGQLGGSLIMANIPSNDRIKVDDTVVTAGIDLGNGVRSPFPKGLVVGRVVDVQKAPNAIVQTAFVDPAAGLDKLEYVLVVVGYQGDQGPVVRPSPLASPSPAASPGPTLPGSPEPAIP